MTTAYDTEGYIDYFTVRGFVVDNRFNFRRDGLPINAETSIPLENKARVDILKGLSGLQAGTSAPGGLVDLVVKRPLDAPLRSAFLEWRERGSVLGSVDISQRFGADDAFGVRLNAGAEHIDPIVRNAKGNRNVIALAGDWRASAATLIEAEIENSHRRSRAFPASACSATPCRRCPTRASTSTTSRGRCRWCSTRRPASLRVTQKLGDDWRLVVHGLVQRLRTDDRIAFPFGCFDPNPPPDGTYYPDRFCPNGNFDLYDFRSENERRRSSTLDVTLHGNAATGPLAHEFSLGVQRTIVKNRFQAGVQLRRHRQRRRHARHAAGARPGRPQTRTATSARPRSRCATRSRFGSSGTTAWLGARHTQLDRSATPTDGSPGTAFKQSFTTPFVALSHVFGRGQLVYASWGKGVESDVRRTCRSTPCRRCYLNAGQALPAAESRQVEVGIKGGARERRMERGGVRHPPPALRRHRRRRPCGAAARAASSATSATRASKAAWRGAAAPGACAPARNGCTRASRSTSDPTLDGKKPTNVPAVTARLQGDWQLPAIAGGGLRLLAAGTYESAREVLPDNSVQIPSVTQFDLGARYETKSSAGTTWTLRAGIDNVFDRRAWRESPYQFSHAYLFPLEPRTLRVSLQADL